MHRFWTSVIEPLLDAAGATEVVEVGVDRGATTRLLLGRAQRIGSGTVHAIDPSPDPALDLAALQLEHGSRLRFHRSQSHRALSGLGTVDAVLLDGDHNWFTVNGELRLLA